MPGSVVSVRNSSIRSSLATLATPSGMPMPRLTTLFGCNSKAARRAMTLRGPMGMGGRARMGTRTSPLKAGL